MLVCLDHLPVRGNMVIVKTVKPNKKMMREKSNEYMRVCGLGWRGWEREKNEMKKRMIKKR